MEKFGFKKGTPPVTSTCEATAGAGSSAASGTKPLAEPIRVDLRESRDKSGIGTDIESEHAVRRHQQELRAGAAAARTGAFQSDAARRLRLREAQGLLARAGRVRRELDLLHGADQGSNTEDEDDDEDGAVEPGLAAAADQSLEEVGAELAAACESLRRTYFYCLHCGCASADHEETREPKHP